MKALLTHYHQLPRKVRPVAVLVRGKSVLQAKAALRFLPKKSSPAIEKLLDSAVANATSMGVPSEGLFIKKITVDKGAMMRRARPFARGRSGSIRKTMSIVSLELGTAANIKTSTKSNRKASSSKKQKKELAPRT